MTPRSQVLRALAGEPFEGIPLTANKARVPRSQTERELRGAGLCLVQSGPRLLHPVYRNVAEERLFSGKTGAVFERIKVRTEAGNLNSVVRHSPERRQSWTTERLFKSARDYLPLIALFQDQRFESHFGAFDCMQQDVGEDILLRPNLGPSPLHYIMHTLMGMDVFAHEWSERRDDMLVLYKRISDNHRRRILQVAKSPASAVTYGGQLNAREIGAERFARYYQPHLREFADVMHTNGKLAGLQVLGDPRELSEGIADTHVDFVEGYQDVGYRLEEARRAWPDMTLWLEVPPAVHMMAEDGLSRWVRDIVKRASGPRALLSTGAIPPDRWRQNLTAIADAMVTTGDSAAAAAG